MLRGFLGRFYPYKTRFATSYLTILMIMLATSTLALILFGAPSRALGLVNLDEKNKGYEESSTIHYTTISGFFLQDDPATDPATFDYVRPQCPRKTTYHHVDSTVC